MSMHLKPGYKMTEVGAMPEEWEVRTIEGIADSKRPICYGIVQVGPFTRNGIPVLAIKNLNTDYSTNVHRSSPKIETPYARSRVRPGDVLISVKGTTGRVGIVPKHFNGNISRDLARLRLNDDDVPEFWFQMLQSEIAQNRFGVATVGTTRMELSIGILKQVRMPRPPKEEQHAIAAALRDVDALIGSLDRLIAKKRDLKQAAMQQLLTGKTRLPGFSGEWEMKKLGDIAEVVMGQSPAGSSYNRTGVGAPLINGPTEFTDKHPIKIQWTSQPTKFCKKEDLLLCVRGSSTGRINISDDEYCIGRGIAAIRAKTGADTAFITFQVSGAIQSILAATTGSTFPNIDGKSIRAIEVLFPSFPEQRAIATVLSDMDTEIAALEQRRDKTRALKQGMMHALLTGQVRLV